MEWKDKGVILGVRRHGEASVIVEAMTSEHGRHLGLVRGGRSSRMRPVLQPGNSVELTWRARLDAHLGQYVVEADRLRAATLMDSAIGLYGLQLMGAHLRLLPERDPHPELYRAGLVILDHLDEPHKAARLMIRFELALLEELGFGLDLSRCTATGRTDQLIYVSPRTGRAVSSEAGEPWAGKLLALPPFLAGGAMSDDPVHLTRQIGEGFALAGYFLTRNVWDARGVRPPSEREGFVAAVTKALASDAGSA